MHRLAAVLLASLPAVAFASGEPEFNLAIEGHKFTPDRIEVPAGKKVKFLVENKDPAPEEFDSGALKVEKVIPGRAKGVLYIGPLKPGEYQFMGEYHEETAQGVVVAK